jgi:hypothetical protein
MTSTLFFKSSSVKFQNTFCLKNMGKYFKIIPLRLPLQPGIPNARNGGGKPPLPLFNRYSTRSRKGQSPP